MFEFTATASIAAHGLTPAEVLEAVRFLLDWGLSLVGLASVAAALTPPPRHAEGPGRLRRLVLLLALNVGFARDRAEGRCRAHPCRDSERRKKDGAGEGGSAPGQKSVDF